MATYDGTNGSDTLNGSEEADVLNGSGTPEDGRDVLNGSGGDDVVNLGGFRRTTVDGGAGDDTVVLTTGSIGFGEAASLVNGGEGRDTIDARASTSDAVWANSRMRDSSGFVSSDLVTPAAHRFEKVEVFLGGSGRDRFEFEFAPGGVEIDGGGGDDEITAPTGILFPGQPNFNVLRGGAGDDTLDGSGALYGGDGDDVLVVGRVSPGSVIDGGAGRDGAGFGDGWTIDLATRTAKLGDLTVDLIGIEDAYVSIGTVLGDDGANILGAESGLIEGRGGDDVLAGAGTLRGGEGNDHLSGEGRLEGGAGADRLEAMYGDDVLFGDAGRDRLYGNNGADELHGGADGDLLEGGYGDDQLFGDDGNDTLVGGGDFNREFPVEVAGQRSGDDMLDGGAGHDLLIGEDGMDRLSGGEGDDLLRGGDGIDVLSGGAGVNRLDGGAGVDFADFGGLSGSVWAELSLGYVSTAGSYDILVGVEGLAGSGFDDQLFGTGGVDYLFGAGGDDVLSGREGDDHLQGGTGVNQLHGGQGLDFADYTGRMDDLWVDLAAGALSTADTWDGFVSIEGVIGGEGDDQLFGTAGLDILGGGAGNDVLTGREGDDRLNGGFGENLLIGGEGIDLADYSGAVFGLQVDLATGAYASYSQPDMLGRTGSTVDRFFEMEGVVGGSSYDRIAGDDRFNVLLGGGEDDVLFGRAGDDFLFGEAGNDRLDGGAGHDNLVGGAGLDVFDLTGGGWDTAADFNRVEDRIDLGLDSLGRPYEFRFLVEGDVNGDGVTDSQLTYDGGTFVALGVTGLTLAEWNDLAF